MNYDFFGRLVWIGDIVAFATWPGGLKEGKVIAIEGGFLTIIIIDVVDWSAGKVYLKPDKVIKRGNDH